MGTAYARMRCIKILLFIFNLSFWVSVGPGAEGGKGGTAAPAGRGLGGGLRRARPDTAPGCSVLPDAPLPCHSPRGCPASQASLGEVRESPCTMG